MDSENYPRTWMRGLDQLEYLVKMFILLVLAGSWSSKSMLWLLNNCVLFLSPKNASEVYTRWQRSWNHSQRCHLAPANFSDICVKCNIPKMTSVQAGLIHPCSLGLGLHFQNLIPAEQYLTKSKRTRVDFWPTSCLFLKLCNLLLKPLIRLLEDLA